MDNTEFLNRCQQLRDEFAGSPAETRARVELYNVKTSQAREAHACLMSLPRADAEAIARRALRLDAQDGLAKLHTNALGVTFYKYFK